MSADKFILVIGPMYSGKTTATVRALNRMQRRKKKCLILKFIKDKRYVESEDDELRLSTHDQCHLRITLDNQYLKLVYVDDLHHELTDEFLMDFDVIAMEEAHMWGESWWPFIYHCLYELDKKVIVSTIDSYFPIAGEPVRPIPHLATAVIHCTQLIKSTSVCIQCNKETATQSVALIEMTSNNVVGGEDAYTAMCWTCFLQK